MPPMVRSERGRGIKNPPVNLGNPGELSMIELADGIRTETFVEGMRPCYYP